MTNLDLAIRKYVPTIPETMKALGAMERQLTSAKTYKELTAVMKQAEALKVLLGHIGEVKIKAENVILAASIRIGEEIQKIPKASGRPGKNLPHAGKNNGRNTIGVPHTSRARLTSLASQGAAAVKKAASELRAQGKDATPRAVATFLTQGDKQQRRTQREQQIATKIKELPEQKYGVILADPEWQWQPWSYKTGMDRAAANHYPTSCLEIIKSRDVRSVSAENCVLFLWATIPMLPHALTVMSAWGFEYKSHYVWAKDKIGTGYWNREKHELLLIGIHGNIPCPAPGTQRESLITAPRRKHSEKPEIFLEMIEQYFPNIPKIELNRRGPSRPGWNAWGPETE